MGHEPAQVTIRSESRADEAAVDRVVEAAFEVDGPVVVRLVADLRRSLAAEPGCSLVALVGGELVGHVMTTRNLLDAPARLVDVQVLSPLAVTPARQGHRRRLGSRPVGLAGLA